MHLHPNYDIYMIRGKYVLKQDDKSIGEYLTYKAAFEQAEILLKPYIEDHLISHITIIEGEVAGYL